MTQKFIDRDGLKVLWKQISLQDYPNNETLMAVIDAIDETKSDKGHTHSWNELEDKPFGEIIQETDEVLVQTLDEKFIPNTIARVNQIPVIPTDMEILNLLAETDIIDIVADENGDLFTDLEGNFIVF